MQISDTTSDFAEIIFAILDIAAKLERRRILERTARSGADAGMTRAQVAELYGVAVDEIDRIISRPS